MGTLRKMLTGLDVVEVKGSLDNYIGNICFDSSKAAMDDVFVAVKGTRVDGHIFIPKVIEKGIRVIICEEFPEEIREDCSYVKVLDSQETLGRICSNYYDRPSYRLSLIGVTGTNGKTTVATLLYRIFTELGYRCGLISTINNIIAGEVRPAKYTTPDALLINRLLSEMLDQECQYVFMEVSSHAAQQKRIAGLRFRGAIFTNLTHDHLDYHKDFAEYRDAKKAFFDGLPENAFALVNADDLDREDHQDDPMLDETDDETDPHEEVDSELVLHYGQRHRTRNSHSGIRRLRHHQAVLQGKGSAFELFDRADGHSGHRHDYAAVHSLFAPEHRKHLFRNDTRVLGHHCSVQRLPVGFIFQKHTLGNRRIVDNRRVQQL
ncbi:MAG: hypothetical protein HGA23_05090 [Bacteroidales bacterium]|nr:hypothetical protein [Bacteroidales bacterium]